MTVIKSNVFIAKAWGPDVRKSKEISCDEVFAEHGAGAVRQDKDPVSPCLSSRLQKLEKQFVLGLTCSKCLSSRQSKYHFYKCLYLNSLAFCLHLLFTIKKPYSEK